MQSSESQAAPPDTPPGTGSGLSFPRDALGVARQKLRRVRTENANRAVWRRFQRNLSFSVSGAVVSVGIKAFQTLLLTRALRVDDYGRVLIVVNLFVLLNSFFGLRVNDLIFRFFQPLREEQDGRALQGMLLFCFGVSLVTGLLIVAAVFTFSPWLAERVYGSRELAALFKVYGWTVLLLSLSDVFGPILRIYDRFTSVILPQVLGSLTTVALLVLYFATTDRYRLTVVVAAFAIGVVVQTVPPLIQALRLVKEYLRDLNVKLAARALGKYRRELIRCLFNSNLSGYLKIAISPGDLFLLGVFSSPTQVALYGLAKQLSGPLALLQGNVHLAITPEITLLVAKRKIEQLKRLIRRYAFSAFVAGGLLVIGSFVLGRVLVVRFSRPEYVEALPMFYLLLIATWALLMVSAFRPLALSFDLLKWDNLTHLTTTLILLLTIVTGWFNGLTMALIQLFAATVLRVMFNLPVWMRLHSTELRSRAEGT